MNSISFSAVKRFALPALAFLATAAQSQAQDRNLFWGDTHIHTYNSADAYLLQNRTVSPDDSYRFAKGQPIIHPMSRVKIQLETPLDFLVVADHAGALGVIRAIFERDPRIVDTPFAKQILEAAERGEEVEAFQTLVDSTTVVAEEGKERPRAFDPETARAGQIVMMSTWHDTVDAAERHNNPGKFTAFIGWEWTPAPGGANLHRVIFMKDGGDIGKKFIPFSSIISSKPEDLWNWLERTTQRTGASFISIPHNSNLSLGQMFDEVDSDGRPITEAYARRRIRWEPVVEATQVKGDSETHPTLSPTDEFADYEYFRFLLTALYSEKAEDIKPGSYIRGALRRGLEIEEEIGVNPYKFGLIGSTDMHTGASSAEEDNYWGKFGISGLPETKGVGAISTARGYDMGAAGLAAVWAEENTRDSLYNAFQRKEVYSTTGPRMQVRFFGGWNFDEADAEAPSVADVGYAKGVPMGGDLVKAPRGKAASFLIRAVKDPVGANLDRIQVIKGWVGNDGKSQEKVFNVALSDGREEKDGKVQPVGNTVDLKTAEYTNTIGDAQLATTWTDPEFDPKQRAFYYVRVLQIPTPRHTLYDAVAMQTAPPEGYDTTIQERAYTSPIWYTPGR